MQPDHLWFSVLCGSGVWIPAFAGMTGIFGMTGNIGMTRDILIRAGFLLTADIGITIWHIPNMKNRRVLSFS